MLNINPLYEYIQELSSLIMAFIQWTLHKRKEVDCQLKQLASFSLFGPKTMVQWAPRTISAPQARTISHQTAMPMGRPGKKMQHGIIGSHTLLQV